MAISSGGAGTGRRHCAVRLPAVRVTTCGWLQELEVKQQAVTEVVVPEAGATCDHAHDHAHAAHAAHAAHHAQQPSAPPPPDTPSSDPGGALVSDEVRTVYLHPGVMDEFMAIAQVRLSRTAC